MLLMSWVSLFVYALSCCYQRISLSLKKKRILMYLFVNPFVHPFSVRHSCFCSSLSCYSFSICSLPFCSSNFVLLFLFVALFPLSLFNCKIVRLVFPFFVIALFMNPLLGNTVTIIYIRHVALNVNETKA